jgi:hypothetical protein
MNDVDERLIRIENHVELLLERQRLSVFDSLIPFAYPMIVLGITLSLTPSVRYEVIGYHDLVSAYG